MLLWEVRDGAMFSRWMYDLGKGKGKGVRGTGRRPWAGVGAAGDRWT
jgi:hypothetical protein